MNRIEKEGLYEYIYFEGRVARMVRRGDVILRPIVVDTLLDRLINWIMPGNFEHAMLYLGDGVLLNPYPDAHGCIHKEYLFDNFSWRNVFNKHPNLLTFARITDDQAIIEDAIAYLEESCTTHAVDGYCSSVIIDAFVQAGISQDVFTATHVRGGLLSKLVVCSFKTGYEIAQEATHLIAFEHIPHKSD